MSLNLKEIATVDDRTKILIYGFNRNCYKLVAMSSDHHNVPPIVNHICILFYWQKEYFKLYGEGIELSDDKMWVKVKQGNKGWNTIYGDFIFNHHLYSNAIIEYEMEIDIEPSYGAIGIAAAGNEQHRYDKLLWNQSVISKTHEAVYTFHAGSLYYKGCGKRGPSFDHLKLDKIRMTVNIPDNSLTYFSIIQNEQIGKYTEIDYSMKYRLGISLTGQQSVKLTDFGIKYSEK